MKGAETAGGPAGCHGLLGRVHGKLLREMQSPALPAGGRDAGPPGTKMTQMVPMSPLLPCGAHGFLTEDNRVTGKTKKNRPRLRTYFRSVSSGAVPRWGQTDSPGPSPGTHAVSDFLERTRIHSDLLGFVQTVVFGRKKKNTSPLPLSLVEIANVINTIHHVKTAKEIQWDGAFGDIISAAYNKER